MSELGKEHVRQKPWPRQRPRGRKELGLLEDTIVVGGVGAQSSGETEIPTKLRRKEQMVWEALRLLFGCWEAVLHILLCFHIDPL